MPVHLNPSLATTLLPSLQPAAVTARDTARRDAEAATFGDRRASSAQGSVEARAFAPARGAQPDDAPFRGQVIRVMEPPAIAAYRSVADLERRERASALFGIDDYA